MKLYITFGHDHYHNIGGRVFDKNIIAAIDCSSREEGRHKAFTLFGCKWSFDYCKEDLHRILPYYSEIVDVL